MSTDEEWANDAEPSNGNSCFGLFALLMLSLPVLTVLLAGVVLLAACRPSAQAPPSPTTGVQQPAVTAVVPSAVEVKP